jgi:hypothetical protein
LEKFKGYHEGVSLYFAQTYDSKSVQFGEMKLTITNSTIVEAIGLTSFGEKYFKGVIVDRNICHNFLRPEHQDADWTKGFPRSCIKEEYWRILISLQRFLTCEGRYVMTFLYHLKLLSHFEGGPQIEFPHFL